MSSHPFRTIFWGLSFVIITVNGFAATHNLCRDASILGLTDRGSITNTPCVLPSKGVMWEGGYQYKTINPGGSQQIFPQASVFVGLPANNEFIVIFPTYNQSSIMPFAGFSATSVGVKHEITYGDDWVVAADMFLTPASGSEAFGSDGFGVLVNGMAEYDFNSHWSMTFMLGGSTLTDNSFAGGRRFNSFNPSLTLTYASTEKMSVFVEGFAQTKTGPGLGGNYNLDCGVLYLLTTNVALDFEVGQQLSDQIYSFNQFFEAGLSIRL